MQRMYMLDVIFHAKSFNLLEVWQSWLAGWQPLHLFYVRLIHELSDSSSVGEYRIEQDI